MSNFIEDLPHDFISQITDYLLSNSDGKNISLVTEKACADIFKIPLTKVRHLVFKIGLMPICYKRNMNSISVDEQYRLFKSKVAVVGCGGLGGYIISQLARLGVGTIKAIDGDAFEEHNLNRQVFSRIDTLGKDKAHVIRDEINNINCLTTLIPVSAGLDETNCKELVSDVDVVADALDTIKTRLILARCCKQMGLPLVHGSIGGWYGQVSVQYPDDDCLINLFEGRSDKGIEEEMGNLSFLPAMVASIQVAEITKILLSKEPSLRKKLLAIDLLSCNFNILEF